jgi:hypothetical protein
MRTTTGQPRHDQPRAPNGEHLPDGIGGTIIGGLVRPTNVVEFPNRDGRRVSRGGAIAGSAQVAVSSAGASGGRLGGITLSDGSRISFASVDDPGIAMDEHFRIVTGV